MLVTITTAVRGEKSKGGKWEKLLILLNFANFNKRWIDLTLTDEEGEAEDEEEYEEGSEKEKQEEEDGDLSEADQPDADMTSDNKLQQQAEGK